MENLSFECTTTYWMVRVELSTITANTVGKLIQICNISWKPRNYKPIEMIYQALVGLHISGGEGLLKRRLVREGAY
jgi:hypothetical protein